MNEFHKTCKRCEKDFTTSNKNKVYCERVHYSECKNCGTTILEKQAKRVTQFCSISCSSKYRKYDCVCELCGTNFKSNNSKARFCSKQHSRPCIICGNSFKIANNHKPAQTCSKYCASQLIDFQSRNALSLKTIRQKYKVDYISQVPSIKEKKLQSSLEKYGVNNPSQSIKVQKKRIATNLERYGVENGGGARVIQGHIQKTIFRKYGCKNIFQVPFVKQKIKNTNLERYGVENVLALPENQLKAINSQTRRVSNINRQWQHDLKRELGIDFQLEVNAVDNIYADLGYGNLYIDINPSITHNSTISYVHSTKRCTIENCTNQRHSPIEKDKHQKRALAVQESEAYFFQHFDWYNKEAFINVIRSKLNLSKNKVSANVCEVKEITQEQAELFALVNHPFPEYFSSTFNIGCFYNGKLIHVQSYTQVGQTTWKEVISASKVNWTINHIENECINYLNNRKTIKKILKYVDLSIDDKNEYLERDWDDLAIITPKVKQVNMNGTHVEIYNAGYELLELKL